VYLQIALFAEGPTDHRFLKPLLRRVCENLCAWRGRAPVELPETLELHSPPRFRGERRDRRILEAARHALGAWNVLFVHADGDGDCQRARVERVDPGLTLIREAIQDERLKGIAVIPVRETEAWVLPDGDALRAALGVTSPNNALGVPGRPREVERVLDPKQALEKIWDSLSRSRRRRGRRDLRSFLQAIGERVSLDVLRQIPAYQEFEKELTDALCELGYLEVDPEL
jgi:hypothetical protein